MDAMALIAGARGLVSNDSGLDARRRSLGIAQVAVFGSTSPEHIAAAEPARPGAVAEGRTRPRLHALLRTQLPLRPHTLPERGGAAARGDRAARRLGRVMDEAGRITEALMRDALLGAAPPCGSGRSAATACRTPGRQRRAARLRTRRDRHLAAGLGRAHPSGRRGGQPCSLPAPCARRSADLRARVPCSHARRGVALDRRARARGRACAGRHAAHGGHAVGHHAAPRGAGHGAGDAERLRKISRHVPGIVFQYRSRPGALSRGYFPSSARA